MIEHRVSLEDDLSQILTEPSEFKYINLDRGSRFEVAVGAEKDAYFTYLFDLSQEIRIEKRTVTSLP